MHIPIHNLKLASTQKNKLNTCEIIFTSGATYQFLNLVIVEHTAYKKIANTSYALAYYFLNTDQIVLHYINPAIQLIVKDLILKPENTWNKETLRLGKIYGFPLHVYKNKSDQLPSNIISSLSIGMMILDRDAYLTITLV